MEDEANLDNYHIADGLDLEWKYKKHIEAYRANLKAKVRRRNNEWSAQIKARIERG